MPVITSPPKKTTGIDKNHWERLTINSGSFPAYAQVGFKFKGEPKDIILTIESGGPIQYSFTGVNVHGELIAATDRSQLVFRRRPATGIWFKGTGVVTIEAWASV